MKRSFFIALIVIICFSRVLADSGSDKSSIEINLPSGTLSLYKDGNLAKEYPLCLGKQSTPTPAGQYRIIYKAVNPYWLNKGDVVPPGPQNPLGVRWMGITRGIGIHGNNKPESIGTYASAGCIRMFNRDVVEVYNQVTVNTPVNIKYDRLKLFEDKYSMKKSIIIYPDIYKKGAEIARQQLGQLSNTDIPEEILKKAREIITKPVAKPLTVSDGIGVFLNNSLITCDALEEDGKIYVNYKAAEDILGLTPELAGKFNIGIKELEGVIYINLNDTADSFGGTVSYDEGAGNAYMDMEVVKVNGVFAGINHGDYDKSDYLTVEAVKNLGYEYSEDSVDIRIFGKGIMKLKRNNAWVINADNLAEALGGSKDANSRYRIVDLKLPVYLKVGKEYFKTENIEGELVLNAETAYSIYERSGRAVETFSAQGQNIDEKIDLETFLEGHTIL
ncbi:MAG: L,D-transpeptidase [Clostridiaceae bacterium]|nr:L,D-transpeptidase [Clostridiaceae bacterium]